MFLAVIEIYNSLFDLQRQTETPLPFAGRIRV